jgi:glycosyltransferase involved in cell wall biosynthesis
MTVHGYVFRRLNPVYSTLQHLANTYRIFREIHKSDPVDVLSIHESQLGYRLARSALGRSVCQICTFHAPVFLEFRLNTDWRLKAEPSAIKRFAIRASEPPLEYWQRRFENGVLNAAAGIVVLSKYSRGHIENNFPSVDIGKVAIVPSGVDVDRFRPADDRRAVREKLGLDPEALHLITVRNLSPRMGLENLVRAVPAILGSEPAREAKIVLSLVGGGALREPLERLAGELGVAGSVRFAGRVSDEDLTRYYQAADLFVLPTEAMEGFGISTVEALSTNVPVVGTPAGATPEILSRIDERLLTRDTSHEAIADAVISWLSWRADDAGTTRYRDEVLSLYTWSGVTSQLETYYEEQARTFAGGRG